MAQAINDFTQEIYKRFLGKLRGDEEIPASLIDEIEKLKGNNELVSSEAICRACEKCEESHAQN
jgi:hypothetical protein